MKKHPGLERLKYIPVVMFIVTTVAVCYLELLSDCILDRQKSVGTLKRFGAIQIMETQRRKMLPLIKKSRTNIFFIESSCSFTTEVPAPGGLNINARKACSVYSTAQLNPDYDVYFLYSCPLSKTFSEESPKYVKELLKLRNLKLIDLQKLAYQMLENSSIVDVGQKLVKSSYRIEHVADVLRLLVLWNFGGTYLDTDFISIRPLSNLGTDWIGAQDEETLANGALSFSPEGAGHDYLSATLIELGNTYNPDGWSDNGPLLITRTLLQFCNATINKNVPVWNVPGCSIKLYSPNTFYPVFYSEWNVLFDDKEWTNVEKRINSSYLIHFWNKLTRDAKLKVGSKQPYVVLAEKYCSGVYYALKDEF